MRASRLVNMLLLLQSRDRVTAGEMAAAFEVSVRTVHRDVEALGAAGVPVYAERGAGGGFRLLPSRRFEINGLTPAEADALPLAALPGVASELGVAEPAAGAALKTRAALRPDLRERVARTERDVLVDLEDPAGTDPPTQLLRGLRSAIAREVGIALRLRRGEDLVTVGVRPLGLVRSRAGWHLVAASARRIEVYAVDAIDLARSTGEAFERPAAFDLGAWWRRNARRSAAG